jgi:hypothetical protein
MSFDSCVQFADGPRPGAPGSPDATNSFSVIRLIVMSLTVRRLKRKRRRLWLTTRLKSRGLNFGGKPKVDFHQARILQRRLRASG